MNNSSMKYQTIHVKALQAVFLHYLVFSRKGLAHLVDFLDIDPKSLPEFDWLLFYLYSYLRHQRFDIPERQNYVPFYSPTLPTNE